MISCNLSFFLPFQAESEEDIETHCSRNTEDKLFDCIARQKGTVYSLNIAMLGVRSKLAHLGNKLCLKNGMYSFIKEYHIYK